MAREDETPIHDAIGHDPPRPTYPVSKCGDSPRSTEVIPLSQVSRPDGAACHDRLRHRNAWIALTAVVALHVADEALTDFLGFYNPVVLSLRGALGWFPAPTFRFGIWLAGLVVLVLVLFALTPVVERGKATSHTLSLVLGAIMFLNGVGHLGGSLYYSRWLPGSTTAPLLLVASVILLRAAHQRRAPDRSSTSASRP